MSQYEEIFRECLQPAIKYITNDGIVINFDPKMQLITKCCGRNRIAKNLFVRVSYFGENFYCKKGNGCKK